MRPPYGIYHGKNATYLSVYNYQHDVSVRLPEEINAQHAAHFSYLKGGQKGGGDVFLLRNGELPTIFGNHKKNFYHHGKGVLVEFVDEDKPDTTLTQEFIHQTETRCDVRMEIVGTLDEAVRDEIRTFSDADIGVFCAGEAKKPRGTRIQYVDGIIPVTEAKRTKQLVKIGGGKKWFIPSCLFAGNVDFGSGCSTSWVPGEEASFDGENFTGYYFYPWGECIYCYAEDDHLSYPKNFYTYDENLIREELNGACQLTFGSDEPHGRPLEYLRFGKSTEPWAPESQAHFIRTLELMIEPGTIGIITTKTLPFLPELAELFRRTRSTLLFSIGWDKYERGACLHDGTNAQRIERVREYRAANVNAGFYMTGIAHMPPSIEQQAAIKASQNGRVIPIQFLPMVFKKKATLNAMSNVSWDHLKGGSKTSRQEDLNLNLWPRGTYIYIDNSKLVPVLPKALHPDWDPIITPEVIETNRGNVNICHHDDCTQYCGGCLQRKGFKGEHKPIKKKTTKSTKGRKTKKPEPLPLFENV